MRNDLGGLDNHSFDGNLNSARSNNLNNSALDYSQSENVTPRPEVIKQQLEEMKAEVSFEKA